MIRYVVQYHQWLLNIYFMKVHMIFPYAAAYREPIYLLLDQSFDCVYHFCENTDTTLNQMDYTKLKDCRFDLKEVIIHGQWRFFKGISSIEIQSGDVVICPGNIRYLSIWALLLRNKLSRRKFRIIFWTHGGYGRESSMQFFLKRLFYRLSDHVFLYGNYAKNIFLQHHIIGSDKMTVVWNSLDYDKQIKYRRILCDDVIQKHFKNGYKTILFIGRLTFEKKLEMLVEAIWRLEQEREEKYNCVFIGTGEAEYNLSEAIKKFKLSDRIWLYGPCYDDDEMYPLLKNADLCVSPGNVGLTAIHVLTYGMPVVTHNDFAHQGPEFEAIVDGVTGSFFKRDDIGSLVECVSSWFNSGCNREEIRANCYRIIDENYNPHVQLEIIKKAL